MTVSVSASLDRPGPGRASRAVAVLAVVPATPEEGGGRFPNRLRQLRQEQSPRPWTVDRLIVAMEQSGRELGLSMPSRQSLKVNVSRWENGHVRISPIYRQVLCQALACTQADLESTGHPDDLGAATMRQLADGAQTARESLRAMLRLVDDAQAARERLDVTLTDVTSAIAELAARVGLTTTPTRPQPTRDTPGPARPRTAP